MKRGNEVESGNHQAIIAVEPGLSAVGCCGGGGGNCVDKNQYKDFRKWFLQKAEVGWT